MKKYILSFLAAIILTACAGEDVAENSAAEEKFFDKNSTSVTEKILSENSSEFENNFEKIETETQKNSDGQQEIKLEKPKIEIEKFDENSAEIKIKNLSENVEKIRVYRLLASDEDPKNVKRVFQKEISKSEIENEKIAVFSDEKISENLYFKDNSNLKCGYFSDGFLVSFVSENEEIFSEFYAVETVINTGTVDQSNAELAGSTACGAAAGTLVIQSIFPVWEDELTERMSLIRGYSALSDDYSIGGKEYYMYGWQISNSVNKFLADSGINDYSLTDHRTEKPTEQTLIELISTGRPAVLEVCYIGGEIVEDFQGYSHWITVNGFRLTEDGYEFRCEDTISLEQRWIKSEFLDNSNKNVVYGFGDPPTRYISSLDHAVVESFV